MLGKPESMEIASVLLIPWDMRTQQDDRVFAQTMDHETELQYPSRLGGVLSHVVITCLTSIFP